MNDFGTNLISFPTRFFTAFKQNGKHVSIVKQMIPKTYVASNSSVTVRVCGSCNWLSNAFCKALLQGNYESAVKLYETGNVNLRCTFADIKKEAM